MVGTDANHNGMEAEMADGTGKHAKGENHQAGSKQEHRGKPELTSKYEGKHTGKAQGK